MTGTTPQKLMGTVTVVVALVHAAIASSAVADSAPTKADKPAIDKKLAQIGIHIRPTDRLYGNPGASDEPTLHCARPGIQCLAANRDGVIARPYGTAPPARGDLVAFQTPPKAAISCGVGGIYLKRLVGLPGDTWAEKDGTVYINGKPLHEPYVKAAYRDHYTYPARKIRVGQYFVMGDNRSGACDSRKWGTVPRRNIIGKLIAIFWPLSRVRRL